MAAIATQPVMPAPNAVSDPTRARLRAAAEKLVGEVFYGTLLKTYRSMGRKGTYGHGGRGEEVFQAQLDQVFAERAGRATHTGLTDAIVKRFERRAALVAAYREREMPANEVKA